MLQEALYKSGYIVFAYTRTIEGALVAESSYTLEEDLTDVRFIATAAGLLDKFRASNEMTSGNILVLEFRAPDKVGRIPAGTGVVLRRVMSSRVGRQLVHTSLFFHTAKAFVKLW